ncbi:ABC transporter ATP-binding protein [Nonomuraea sp. NPDC050547]|uniref:ABC transporter ATP-binding protein n=1 Tax=Nonomuraea sp. NPDC050547 TaxID=3364368 RepID=UPI0037A1B68E
MTAIEVEHLSKSFGKVHAVDDLSFTVERGTITAFLGPNGAGKTTTLRMILGLVTPMAGTATIAGVPYAALDRPISEVGAVLESAAFHPGLTAAEHLRALATAAGLDLGRVPQVLARTGLAGAADRKAGGFSLGMRQRLALAGALLGDPRTLVLDEPANGLDPAGMHWLREFLRAFTLRGGTVLVSTHVLAEIQQVAERVVIINEGRLAWSGESVADLEELYLKVTA